MLKLSRYEEKDAPHVLIFLDDLIRIVQRLKEKCGQVSIRVENFLLEECSEAELEQLRETLQTSSVSKLRIRTEEPALEIDLFSNWGRLTIHDADDPLSRGLAEDIFERLRYHRLPRLLRKIRLVMELGPWLLLLITLALFHRELISRSVFLSITVAASVMSIGGFSIGIFGYGSVVLRLEKRADHTSFLFRTRDALITGGILAALAGLIALLIKLYIH